MKKVLGEMKVHELRRELRLLGAWIRDVNAPKQARIREIKAEIGRREEMAAEEG